MKQAGNNFVLSLSLCCMLRIRAGNWSYKKPCSTLGRGGSCYQLLTGPTSHAAAAGHATEIKFGKNEDEKSCSSGSKYQRKDSWLRDVEPVSSASSPFHTGFKLRSAFSFQASQPD